MQKKIVVGSLVALLVASGGVAYAALTSELLPNTDGHHAEWITKPTSASSHFSVVDEATCNGKTDFLRAKNGSVHVGKRDSVAVDLSSIPDGSTITAISISPCASRNSSKSTGSSQLDLFYRLNGVDSADGGAYALAVGNTPVELASTTFSGLSTIKSSTTTLEVGVEYDNGNRGVRVSRLGTYIEYDEPALPPAAPTFAYVGTTTLGTTTQANLYWQDNSDNEDSFEVERSTNGGAYIPVASLSANSTSYSEQVFPGNSYTYRVYARNGNGDSGYSVSNTINP